MSYFASIEFIFQIRNYVSYYKTIKFFINNKRKHIKTSRTIFVNQTLYEFHKQFNLKNQYVSFVFKKSSRSSWGLIPLQKKKASHTKPLKAILRRIPIRDIPAGHEIRGVEPCYAIIKFAIKSRSGIVVKYLPVRRIRAFFVCYLFVVFCFTPWGEGWEAGEVGRYAPSWGPLSSLPRPRSIHSTRMKMGMEKNGYSWRWGDRSSTGKIEFPF